MRDYTENKRLKFTIIVGTNKMTEKRHGAIVRMINHFYGGCTYSQKTGTWNEETGDQSQKWYQTNAVTENAYTFEVVTDRLDIQANEEIFHRIFGMHCHKIANWIHVECQEVLGLHFSINEYRESGESEFRLITNARQFS